jgi:predicted acylesterase/phospholipase RssA/CRP-like cAMP-binding protein
VQIEQTDHRGDLHKIAECSRGDSVGELGLLTHNPCAATVRAIRDCTVLRLPRLTFDRIIEQYPRLCLQLARTTAIRIQENLGAIPKPNTETTIALVALSEDIDLKSLCDILEKTIGATSSVRVVGSAELDARHGKGFSQVDQADARHSDVISVLNRLESEASFVLLRADSSGLTQWTQRCLRQADEIVFVAKASSSPIQTAIELRVLELLREHGMSRLRLVLLHPPETSAPSGTAGWTASRPGTVIQHVREAHLPDIRRLARGLTGQLVGMALSGGGARGFAHIGVLRALSEAGIEPDIIGGTSMGAVIGAQLAMGMSYDDMIRVNRYSWVDAKPWSDYTLPFSSVISGRRLARMLSDMFGDRHIEDLWLRYFCVSSNLTRAIAAEHHHGPLARWVLATASVPGLAPPVFHCGEVYVDGGIANNLPGDVVRRLSAGTVIAIDTSSETELTVDPELESCPTGRAMLKHRFLGKPDTPSLYEILFRCTDIASEKTVEQVRKDADLYLRPPLEGFSNGHFDRIEKIAEEGYRYGLDAVAQFVRKNPHTTSD